MKLIETYKSPNFNERRKETKVKYIILHYTAMTNYLDSIKQIPENGYVNWETFNNKEKISLIPKLGLYSTGHYFNDVALLGKTKFSWNYKTRRSKRELLKLGRNDIWNKIEATFEYIRKSYQNYPHLIESDGKLTKSIGRKGSSIKILPNKFEHLVLPG